MLDDYISQEHDGNAIISREILLPYSGMTGQPAVTGNTWSPKVYDYIFSENMRPYDVETFLRASAEAELTELMEIKQEDYI